MMRDTKRAIGTVRDRLRILRAAMPMLLLLCPAWAAGQTAEPFPASNPTERSAEYESLSRDVAALQEQASVLKRVVKLVRPAVAHIEVRKSRVSPDSTRRKLPPDETGSGVIFRHKNNFYMLTNRHLIRSAEASEITVTLADGRELKPVRTWMDSGTDVAVMRIDDKNLVAARFGDSDRLEIGDYVLAIGSPFGLSHSVTFGIISAKGRRDLELATDDVNFQDFLQIDASINPGNSGGPLVNLRGEVIGINTAIASTSGRNEGIGFSIPINMAKIVAYQLIERGEVVRGFLGVKLDARFGAAAATAIGLDRPRGARISSVSTGTPADDAELEVGDVIVRFDGTWIENDSHLVNRVSLTEVGTEVPVVVYRDGRLREMKIKLTDRRKWTP